MDASEHLRAAVQAQSSGDLAAAREHYTAALDVVRSGAAVDEFAPFETAWLGLARLAQTEGRTEECLTLLGEAIESLPERANLRSEYAAALLRCVEPDLVVSRTCPEDGPAAEHVRQALAHLEQGLDQGDKRADVYATLGAAQALSGRYDRAREAWGLALGLDESHPVAAINLARLSLVGGDAGAAEEYLTHVHASGTWEHWTSLLHGAIALVRAQYDRVEAVLAPAREHGRTRREALWVLARTLHARQEHDRCLEVLDRLARSSWETELLRARCLAGLQRGDDAADVLKRCSDTTAAPAAARWEIVRQMLAMGRFADAMHCLPSAADASGPTPAQQAAMRAAILMAAGRPDDAMDTLSKALDAWPHDPELETWLAWSALLAGRSDEAERHSADVLQLSPDDVRASLIQACTSAERGDIDGALERTRHWPERYRADPVVARLVAQWEAGGGDADAALAHFEQLLERDAVPDAVAAEAMRCAIQADQTQKASRWAADAIAQGRNTEVGIQVLSHLIGRELKRGNVEGTRDLALSAAEACADAEPEPAVSEFQHKVALLGAGAALLCEDRTAAGRASQAMAAPAATDSPVRAAMTAALALLEPDPDAVGRERATLHPETPESSVVEFASRLLEGDLPEAPATVDDLATQSEPSVRGSGARLLCALSYYRRKDFLGAVHWLDPLCRSDDEVTAELPSALGRHVHGLYIESLRQAGHHRRADAAQKRWPDTDDRASDASDQLGGLLQQGRLEQAAELLRESLAQDPSNASARRQLVGCYCALAGRQVKEGDYARAHKLINQALTLAPNRPELLRWRTLLPCHAKIRRADRRDAIGLMALLGELVELLPRDPRPLKNLWVLTHRWWLHALHRDDKEHAKQFWSRFLDLWTRSIRKSRRFWTWMQRRCAHEAFDAPEGVRKTGCRLFAGYHTALASRCLREGRLPVAVAHFRCAIATSGRPGHLGQQAARLLIEEAERRLGPEPWEDAGAAETVLALLKQASEFGAAEAAERARVVESKLLVARAREKANAGELPAAKMMADRAISLWPDNQEAVKLRAKILAVLGQGLYGR